MPGATTHSSICRFCTTGCPVLVDVEDGKVVKVSGNREAPSYYGFCCTRGQAVPEQLNNPERLLTSVKRATEGRFAPIAAEAAMDEIATRLQAIAAEHGPDSVAAYMGTYTNVGAATVPFMTGFLRSFGTSSVYSANTIDQPGKDIAIALLGGWEAGLQTFGDADVWMILGGNGLVSIAVTLPGQNPGRRLTDALARGMKLIVIDPRRTQTADRAHLHLQPRPGEDASIVAGMIRHILANDLFDARFVVDNVSGLDALRRAVEPFTPDYVASRADIPPGDLVKAAEMFAKAGRGIAVGATGVNMSGRSSLNEYLILALNTICGRFLREGDSVPNPGVLLPRAVPKAQPRPPRRARGLGPELSVRGLTPAISGMPTAALADEILNGRIRALVSVGGNPVAAWPDQARTLAALEKLDLFVQVDIKMSASAKAADYVIAPKIGFEVPTASYLKESMELYSAVAGAPEPMGLYAPKLVDPPEGSDLIEEWEFFYGLARRMGLGISLKFPNRSAGAQRERRSSIDIDMESKPSSDDILEMLCSGSRIPLDEVKKHPNGALFPEDIRVAPKDPDCDAKMNVGDEAMLGELAEMLDEPVVAELGGTEFPLLLVSRRMAHVYNSAGRDMPQLVRKGGSYNPLFVHPDDLSRLGIEDGEDIDISSRHGMIRAVAEEDQTMRPGVVSLSHAFGDHPSQGAPVRSVGSNVGALLSVEDDFDRHSGIPRMSAVPVCIVKAVTQ